MRACACGAGFQPAGRFLIGPIPSAYASSAAPHTVAVHLSREEAVPAHTSYAAQHLVGVHLSREEASVSQLGQEVAGTIEAMAEGVTRVALGDRVAGTPVSGAYASYAPPHLIAVHLSRKQARVPKEAAGTIEAGTPMSSAYASYSAPDIIAVHLSHEQTAVPKAARKVKAIADGIPYISVPGAVKAAAVHLKQKVHP
jgi:hypothetical protein